MAVKGETQRILKRVTADLEDYGFCRNSGVWPRKIALLVWKSNRQGVELLSCGHGLASGSALPLANHVHCLDACNEHACTAT
jgi:hypothetical protein